MGKFLGLVVPVHFHSFALEAEMPTADEITAANERYAAEFAKTSKGTLPMPPGRKLVVLTCMDARLDPAKYAGLAEGDAHVIRNAGGRATDDAIRSLVISHNCSVPANGL